MNNHIHNGLVGMQVVQLGSCSENTQTQRPFLDKTVYPWSGVFPGNNECNTGVHCVLILKQMLHKLPAHPHPSYEQELLVKFVGKSKKQQYTYYTIHVDNTFTVIILHIGPTSL